MAHDHNHSSGTKEGIRTAFFLNIGFALAEIAGGLWTNSVAILSDAVHDLGDSLSLGFAWYMEGKSAKPRDSQYSYGYRRFSVLGALINSLILIGGAVFVLSEAIPRLTAPEHTYAPGMIIFGVAGIVINGIAVLRLRGRSSLNAAVVMWHLLEDVLGAAAILIVSILLLFTDWYILDPILSILITALIVYNVIRNLRSTLRVFLQAVPENLNIGEVEDALLKLDGIKEIHHTHIWTLDGEHHVLTTHAVVADNTDLDAITALKARVREKASKLGLWHTTVEGARESDDCEGQDCD
jgi:cobalt-zinc-cadmium efflux system protein